MAKPYITMFPSKHFMVVKIIWRFPMHLNLSMLVVITYTE